jgi:hypothetical protein
MTLKTAAEAFDLDIPEDQLEEIQPVLDELIQRVRRALDHDLSTVDPVTAFRPRTRG